MELCSWWCVHWVLRRRNSRGFRCYIWSRAVSFFLGLLAGKPAHQNSHHITHTRPPNRFVSSLSLVVVIIVVVDTVILIHWAHTHQISPAKSSAQMKNFAFFSVDIIRNKLCKRFVDSSRQFAGNPDVVRIVHDMRWQEECGKKYIF